MLNWVTASRRKGMGVSTEEKISLDVFFSFQAFAILSPQLTFVNILGEPVQDPP